MTDETLIELQKLNKKLEIIDKPLKNIKYNFIAGVSHSLGSLFGTLVIAAIIAYIFSQLNLGAVINKYIQSLIPKPQINVVSPF